MKVKCDKYSEGSVYLDNQMYHFHGGIADIPDHLGLQLVQGDREGLYEIIGEEEKSGKEYPRFDPYTWTKDKKIIWDGPVGYNNGYGKASMMVIEALAKHSDLYVVNSKWIGSTMEYASKNLEKILKRQSDKIDSFYIKFFPAFEFTKRYAQRYIGYTMLEASRIPKSWVRLINQNCERCIVPTKHQYQAFVDSGVRVDVKVIPLGIIPEWFPLLDRKEDSLFYFGTMGTLTYRKGTDILVKAFMKGLDKKKYPDARLYIKTLPLSGIGSMWFMSKEEWKKDGRIDFNVESFSPEDLIVEFFQKVDAFVFPTRGEGFGLPVMEAMHTGLPVIVTNYSGPAEFITKKVAYPLKYEIVGVPNGEIGGYPEELQADGQQWAEPNFDDLVDKMRYVYNHRKEAREIGVKGHEYINQNFTADHTAKKIVTYLNSKF